MDNFLFRKDFSTNNYFGEESLPEFGNLCSQYDNLLVFADEFVFSLHQNFLQNILAQSRIDYEVFSLPRGEDAKDIDLWKNLTNKIMEKGLSRKSAVVAIGGGAISDFSGFFASTCMRGLDHIIFPTTVLAMVDAALGGKTAINNKAGKNMVGTWHFPEAVFFLPAFLGTLTGRELLSGLGEMVKHSILGSAELFEELQAFLEIFEYWQDFDKESNFTLVEKIFPLVISAQKIKMEIVQKDPFQHNLRYILNFGHSAGHALEALSNYKLLHGIAVLQGMRTELEIGLEYFNFPQKDFELIVSFLDSLLESESIKSDYEGFRKYLVRDKKNLKKSTIISLPSGLGKFESASFLKKVDPLWFANTNLFRDG
ncbi:MAG: 3-dehydroquinate synthase [Deltaproteobacteria bacterium]|jgi:3-dehydroquinate synthase|nr:3-dehydroquinate synthase [Deltaproteobacteria bacterium]